MNHHESTFATVSYATGTSRTIGGWKNKDLLWAAAPHHLVASSEIPFATSPFPGDATTAAAYPPVMCSYEQYAITESR